jgi:hypothetical protein
MGTGHYPMTVYPQSTNQATVPGLALLTNRYPRIAIHSAGCRYPVHRSHYPQPQSPGLWSVWISPLWDLSKWLWATPLWESSKSAVGSLWSSSFGLVHRLSIDDGRHATVHRPHVWPHRLPQPLQEPQLLWPSYPAAALCSASSATSEAVSSA